jgi:hypothetical protein
VGGFAPDWVTELGREPLLVAPNHRPKARPTRLPELPGHGILRVLQR